MWFGLLLFLGGLFLCLDGPLVVLAQCLVWVGGDELYKIGTGVVAGVTVLVILLFLVLTVVVCQSDM